MGAYLPGPSLSSVFPRPPRYLHPLPIAQQTTTTTTTLLSPPFPPFFFLTTCAVPVPAGIESRILTSSVLYIQQRQRPPYCRIGGTRHVLPSPLTASQPTNTDSPTGHDRPFSPPIHLLPLCNISPGHNRTAFKTKPVLESQFLLFLNSLFEPP